MKVHIIGKVHREGIAKKTNKPYNFNEIHFTGPARGVIGEAAITKTIEPTLLNFDDIVVPGDYLIEYDSNGTVISLAPALGK